MRGLGILGWKEVECGYVDDKSDACSLYEVKIGESDYLKSDSIS